jgi:hypothetical protein
MQVVGFAGPARVGKSFATNALKTKAEEQGWTVMVLPFAGPLKREAEAKGFGKDNNPEEYRKFCQEHGAEMRSLDSEHWVKRWLDDLRDVRTGHFENDSNESPLLIIADDVRYENELELITEGGGYTFFLSPGDRELPEADAAWRTHESEMLANSMVGNHALAKQEFDYVVLNEGTPEDMDRWAHAVMKLVISHPGDESMICDCEGCNASLENRPVDQDTIAKELDDLLDDLEGRYGKEEDDDDDD